MRITADLIRTTKCSVYSSRPCNFPFKVVLANNHVVALSVILRLGTLFPWGLLIPNPTAINFHLYSLCQ